MNIYLVTHAHTEQQVNVPAEQWRLSARGQAEARALASQRFWDDVDRVVVTSEAKTWLTVAEVVAARALPVWVDARLDELRRTGWVEDYAARVASVFADPNASIGGWEAAANVERRAMAALADLQQRFAGETLAVIGHGLCLSIVRAAILGQPRVDFDTWQRLPFGSHAMLSLAPGVLRTDFALLPEGAR